VAHSVLHFDRFSLDLTRGCARVGEQDLALRHKTFDVLRFLAENTGRLVTKQELYEAVWPDVIVSDDSIVQCIRELRSKFGDGDHKLIKTVPRRGYMLDATATAPVAAPPAPAPQQSAEPVVVATPPAVTQPQPGWHHRVRPFLAHKFGGWVAVAVVLLIALWGVNSVIGGGPGKLAAAPKPLSSADGQFDGIWRIEFANNEFCIQRARTVLWTINQGVVKGSDASKLAGTISGTGELHVTWPSLADPTVANAGSARLQADRGEGKWDGNRSCAGAMTLTRVAPP
jgi:DNA-binding winged helix-turn-helix (wHTH) protein